MIKAKTIFLLGFFIIAVVICLTAMAKGHNDALAEEISNLSRADTDNDGGSNMIQYYLCTDYGDMFHCDRSLSNLRSFEVSGNWSEIFRPSGIATYVDGKYGKALLLEGASDREYLEINNTQTINPTNFSVSFWFKAVPEQENPGAIVSHSSVDRDAGWDVLISENGTISFEMTDSSGSVVETVSNRSSSSGFTHIVGTFNGTNVALYTNGSIDDTHSFKGEYVTNPNSPLKIGGIASSTGTLLWTGIIDDMALYNRTLEPEEIRSIYESDKSYHTSKPNGLISHWPFDETLNDTAAGNSANNGVLRTLITSMSFTPDGRLFFAEKNTGAVRIMDKGKVLDKPFVTIPDVYVDVEQGLLSLAVDPLFETNHYVYLYYTANNEEGGISNRLVRLTESNNTAINEVILMDNIPASPGYHSGGALAVGPDEKIYLGVGDATISEFVQNPTVLLGKVLRIDRDGRIPEDNPFPGSPVYTLGHRNLFGIAFDNSSGLGLIAENGDDLFDEINLIRKGGNYGFPTMQPPNVAPETANYNSSILPIRSYWRTPAPTQMLYYDWDKYPELKDRFLVGTFDGDIYALKFDETNRTIVEEQWIELGIYPYSAVIAVAASPVTKDVYFAGNAIYQLDKIDSSSKEQTVFPVTFEFDTGNNTVDNVEVSKGENETITFSAEIDTSNLEMEGNTEEDDESKLRIEIPKSLIHEIDRVTVTLVSKSGNVTSVLQPEEVEINGSVYISYMPSSTYYLEITGSSN